MNRSDAIKKLLGQRSGCYLIRKSETWPADYTLSVSCHDGVQHHRIQTVRSGVIATAYFINTLKRFPSLSSLVDYYSCNAADGLSCRLTHPCDKAEPLDYDYYDLIASTQKLSNSLGAGQEQADEEADEHCYVDVCSDEGNKL